MYSMEALYITVCVVQVELSDASTCGQNPIMNSFMHVNYSQIQILIYIQLEKQGDWGGMPVELRVKEIHPLWH